MICCRHLGRNVTWLAGAFVGCAAALYIQLGAGHFLQQYGIFLVAVMLGASSCVLLITRLVYRFLILVIFTFDLDI